MNTTELHDLFRLEVDDTETPYLWTSAEVYSYMDAAQKMFVRLTGGIRDLTSPLCSVDILDGEALADIDARILAIVRIQRDSDGKKLELLGLSDIDDRNISIDNQKGEVTAAITGLQANTLRWLMIPAADDTATMVVDRLPLNTITGLRTQQFEIDERHHRYLLLWMKSLAYAKQDTDTADTARAMNSDAVFRSYCAQAKNEKFRQQNSKRTVRYGGL
jgi:hypothetical protein